MIFEDSYIFLETSNASEEFILHFPVEVLGASKSPGEYDVFYEFDLEGMAKFILDIHLSMYRERNECHVERGVEVWTLVGATWHWSDLTFIEPSVVKLDYGKVSASDISSFNTALWYEKLHERI